MSHVHFTVLGKCEPGGSKRGFPVHRSCGSIGVSLSDANPRVKSWRQEVAQCALDAMDGPPWEGPVVLTLHFYLTRPKSVKRQYPSVRPDVLKLARAVEDAMTGIVYRDDAQIVEETLIKRYANTEPPQVVVIARTLEE